MERITLAVGGHLPGIPGFLAPGTYDINWQLHTATLVPPNVPVVIPTPEPVPEPESPRRSLMTNGG